MSGVADQVELGLRPRPMEFPRSLRRRRHVVSTLHDDTGDAVQRAGVAQQLLILEETVVDKVVVLNPREGQRKVRVAVRTVDRWIGQQGDGPALPATPCHRGLELRLLVYASEPTVVGPDEVMAFRRRNGGYKALPLVR